MENQKENGVAVQPKQPAQLMQVLSSTRPQAIAELDFVKDKYVQNYNLAHGNKMGELIYHRNLVHIKSIIANSSALQGCDPFSIYACIVTAAVNGYSFDPEDGQVYILPRGGKAMIQRQAPAHVQRLKRTRQIIHAEPVKLVYEGDTFKVQNGVVIMHEEVFESEKIIAGYVVFVLDAANNKKYFIYRKSDWESWREKSPNKNGDTWTGGIDKQPQVGFLKTKILLHACKEKTWAAGNNDPRIEAFNVEIDEEEDNNPAPTKLSPVPNIDPSQPQSDAAKEAALHATGSDHEGVSGKFQDDSESETF